MVCVCRLLCVCMAVVIALCVAICGAMRMAGARVCRVAIAYATRDGQTVAGGWMQHG